jgi:hypothetical protein
MALKNIVRIYEQMKNLARNFKILEERRFAIDWTTESYFITNFKENLVDGK